MQAPSVSLETSSALSSLPSAQELRALITLHPDAIEEAELHFDYKKKESELFSLGLRFCKYKKYDLAMVFFCKILDKNEKNGHAYVNIGNIFYQKKNIPAAVNFWRYALSIDASCEKAYLNLGNYYYTQGNVDKAISYWLILQTISPKETISIYNLGVAYADKKEFMLSTLYFEKYLTKENAEGGSSNYERLSKKMRNNKIIARHNFKIGLKCQGKKAYPEALKSYMKALEAYPNHIKSNLNAGSICYINNKFEKAIQFWNRALILEPKNTKILINIAIANDKAKKYSYAFCYYSRYLKNLEDQGTFEAVKVKDRIKEIEVDLEDKNTLYTQHYSKAEEFFKNKDYLNAYSEYENCLVLNPDNEALEKRLGLISSALNPERNVALSHIKSGKKAMQRSQYLIAIDHFQEAYRLTQNDEIIKDIKENMTKCAKILRQIHKF